ncbi:MAG: clostripain-related cysteine peptidase [Caldilineaceae bacterium]
MCRRTLRILLVIVSILYFTIGAPQSSSAAAPRSTMATAEARYHPFFPKSSGKGLQGVLHVQNAGTADANFQVDFYTEQGAVVKRYYGTVKPGAAQTIAAQAWTELPVGVYGVRVTTTNAQPLITVVRVKDTSRAVPGLGFDPGVSQSRLATTLHGGPIYGGAKASTIHLFNPTTATVNGEIVLTTLTGTPVAPRTWSLPAYGRTTITFNTQPADFVGTVQITASTATAALLQQTIVNDGIELQAFNPPATRHFLPRVLKADVERAGVYTSKLLISNPAPLAVSVNLILTSNEHQPTTTSFVLQANQATLLDLRDLSGVADGVYWAAVNSTTPVTLSEITDAMNATGNANGNYAGQDFAVVAQRQAATSRLFFPRAVRADHGNSSLTLQNSSDSEAAITIAAYNADGSKNGADLTDRIPAKGAKKYNPLSIVAAGFIGSIVVSSDRPLVGWMDEVVLTGDEPDPELQPVGPHAPVADFFSTKREGAPPFQVQFVNTSEGEYISSQWDFGDGKSSTESSPIHTYAITGTYTVKLTVTGPGGSHTITKADLIKVHSFPPIHPDGWDLTFGDYGYIDTQCEQSGPLYNISMMQRQNNGKIVVLLGCDNHNGLILARYEADGSIDLNFGTAGRIYLPYTQVSALLVQADGKIMIVHGLKISRFLADGALDQTFGTLGVADLFPDADQQSYFSQSLLQPDGKLIAVGRKNNQPIIARYTATGALDTSFNNTGYLLETISTPATNDDAANRWEGLLLLLNDKLLVSRKNIVVTDTFTGAIRKSFILKRFNNNGTPDLIFGTGGIVEFDTYFEPRLAAPQLALADGKVLFANGPIRRLTYNGALDSTFTELWGTDIKSDSSARLYVTDYDGIRRYSLDGVLDPSFGKQGIIETPNSRLRTQLLIEPSGNVLLMQLKQELVDTNKYKVVLLRYIDDHPLPPPTAKPLTLLYAVLDNNLGDGWTRLVNNIETGVRSGMTVRLLIDGPTDNDVYLYDVMPDINPFCPSPTNPTCNGRYVEGTNFWRVANENSAHPDSLYQFLVDAMNAYPTADKINLSLIGHGSGWSANVLPGQPSIWRDQNDTVGGMLWDDHPALGQQDSRSLSTKALGQALTWAGEQTGRKIDLLYLDGCSMGMAEVAYEVRNGARYLLASPNIDWASFNYHALLPEITNATGRALGERWLQLEAAEFRANPGHPFTLSLLDLSQMGGVATAASALADSLRDLLPAQQAQLLAAFTATDRFDSDYDGDLDTADAYSDLPAFVGQVSQSLPNVTAVQQAVQTLQTALTAAVVAKDAANGSPWLFGEQLWQWRNYGGLGIYLPLGKDEVRRRLFYHANNLAWTADTTWDEFLTAFWGGNAATVTDMPVCHATTQGCQGLANPLPVQTPTARFVYLPVARK